MRRKLNKFFLKWITKKKNVARNLTVFIVLLDFSFDFGLKYELDMEVGTFAHFQESCGIPRLSRSLVDSLCLFNWESDDELLSPGVGGALPARCKAALLPLAERSQYISSLTNNVREWAECSEHWEDWEANKKSL